VHRAELRRATDKYKTDTERRGEEKASGPQTSVRAHTGS
jgi:hypothetical protein